MNAPVNAADPTTTGVAQGSDCSFTEYSDSSDATKTTTGVNPALCGLNMD